MLGEVNGKELGIAFVELIELARAIRGKLGCRKYLLDQYLLRLLEMANSFSYLDLSDDGEEAAGSFANSAVRQFAERMRLVKPESAVRFRPM